MEKTVQLYEGKAKKVYATDDPDLVIVSYKDDATALDGLKRAPSRAKALSTTGCQITSAVCWSGTECPPTMWRN